MLGIPGFQAPTFDHLLSKPRRNQHGEKENTEGLDRLRHCRRWHLRGGWNSWNIGVKSWKVKEAITQPIGDYPLYICGEAYSDAQGWVEGALQTADLVLGRLGLCPL